MMIANIILEDSLERVYVKNRYGDIPSGVYLVRGENINLIGEIVNFVVVFFLFLIDFSSFFLGYRH
jgi:hypothetical protein